MYGMTSYPIFMGRKNKPLKVDPYKPTSLMERRFRVVFCFSFFWIPRGYAFELNNCPFSQGGILGIGLPDLSWVLEDSESVCFLSILWVGFVSLTLPGIKLAPENGWLEYYDFLVGFGLFSGTFAVSFRDSKLLRQ